MKKRNTMHPTKRPFSPASGYRVFLSAALALLLPIATASADVITSVRVAYSGLQYVGPIWAPEAVIPLTGSQSASISASTGPAASSATLQVENGVYVSASAAASYGSVSMLATAAVSHDDPQLAFASGSQFSGAYAFFSDTIATLGPAVSGWLEATYTGDCAGGFPAGLGGPAVFGVSLGSASSASGSCGPYLQYLTPRIPFVLGSAFDISAWASAEMAADYPHGSFGSASVSLASLAFYGESGELYSGFSYRAESGSEYNFVGATAIPEPALLLLLGTGAAGVVAVRRRRT